MSEWKKCTQCRNYSYISKGSVCRDCEAFTDDKGEVDHDTDIRCPKCGHQENVWDSEQYSLIKDGGDEATCSECGHRFDVNCTITYNFQSPARLVEKTETTDDELPPEMTREEEAEEAGRRG
jgi:transcription elongation factor Elf1